MNPIEKCWRRIKQALHRHRYQPTTVAETEEIVREDTTRLDKSIDIKEGGLSQLLYATLWIVYS
jgi:hypothetical protein